MGTHTPGPWEWDQQILVRRIQPSDVGAVDALVGEWDDVILGALDDIGLAEDFVNGGGRDFCDWSVNKANARLIAAAPDLLSIAERAVELIECDLTGVAWKRACREFTHAARDAIAKATGGES